MGFLNCDNCKNEVSDLQKENSDLQKELEALRIELSRYINRHGVINKSSVKNGGSRKRKTKRTKQRSRRSRD